MRQTTKATPTFIEARIIIFFDYADRRFRYPSHISEKWGLSYSHVVRRLRRMQTKGWIHGTKRETRVFYSNTSSAPLDEALEILSKSGS